MDNVMTQQEPKYFLERSTKRIVKLEMLSTSLNKYTQFETEATIEVYFPSRISKLCQ